MFAFTADDSTRRRRSTSSSHGDRARARRYRAAFAAVARSYGAIRPRAPRRAALQGRPRVSSDSSRRIGSGRRDRRPDRQLPRHRRRGAHRRTGARAAPRVPRAGAGGRAHRQLGRGARRIRPPRLVGGDPSHLRRAARRSSTASSTAFFAFVHPDDRAAVRAASDTAATGGQPVRHRASHHPARRRRALGARAGGDPSRRAGAARSGWSAPCRTSPSGGCSRISCGSRRRWKRSAGSPAASPTI